MNIPPGWFPDGKGGYSKPKPQAPAAATEGVEVESDLHNEILQECKSNGWIALHGSMAQATGRTVGEPDFVILLPNRVLFVECKTRTGKLSPEQLALHVWMQQLGHTAHVVRSIAEFRSIVRDVTT